MVTTLNQSAETILHQTARALSHHTILTQVRTYIHEYTSKQQAVLLSTFAWHYYKNAPLETLQSCSIETLYHIVLAHWEFSEQRLLNTSKIRVYNPEQPTAWAERYTVIMIATDDMPFIVDSISMEIMRRGLTNHFMIHLGNLMLQRSPLQGTITAVMPTTPPALTDTIPSNHGKTPHELTNSKTSSSYYPEALLYMVIDRQQSPEALSELEVALQTILTEVRSAVADWSCMRDRMMICLKALEQHPSVEDKTDHEEFKAFLLWLLDNHFIFLGCRDYRLSEDQKTLRMVRASSLGVLRDESSGASEKSLVALPPEARQLALSPQVLVFSTTNTKARVHRPVYTEYIAIKRFNAEGHLVGECRFVGLYTSTVYQCDARTIPLVRRKLDWVLTQSQLPHNSHSGKALLDILLNLPRSELLQASAPVLLSLAFDMLILQEKPAIRLFLRQDSYQRFMSCLVYVPKEQLTTALQKKIEVILMQAFAGLEFSFETVLGESRLARIHFLIRTRPKKIPSFDVKQLEAQLVEVARSWQDKLQIALQAAHSAPLASSLFQRYHDAFSGGYREIHSALATLQDIAYIEQLSDKHPLEMNLYLSANSPDTPMRFRLFQIGQPIILSTALAILENMGLQVIDEWPTEVRPAGQPSVWIHDFGLKPLKAYYFEFEKLKPLFQEAFQRIWQDEAENDNFNQLVLGAGLSWKEVVVLRAYTKYMRQIGIPFSQTYIETALTHNAIFIRLLIEFFNLQFNPSLAHTAETGIIQLTQQLENALESVVSLDEDRILRQLWNLICATLRTNYFQHAKSWLSFKLDSHLIPDLPKPKPCYEIFVYSPQMEGIHLRASKVARGGLRWSDRQEDFRTEVLGLMKAQQVKNAVIVPAGAKGGFVCKALPTDRDMIQQHVISCYQTFIRGLLDLTDNLQEGIIVPPPNTVRRDEDDPYLVVAADKGTASFSDIANQIAAEYHFWLGDAFASGGSQGYDHKKMGITARGAWESVKCHCHALGIHPDRDDFTVVGIGDMSGDVFGNGMLLSQHIKLIAAFNHLHIFIDPNPNTDLSFTERKRLFELPRSSWADYNPQLISRGGGVFSRSQKSIPLSPEIQQFIGSTADSLSPDALIRALLSAPVDLLWNGGIGTYVKASHERHSDVGDKSNDNLRVDAQQLRCRMVGEGGNLGFTQLGRIEYALKGGLIYTDFIDNSAGVDCSDHEVNCKILLNAAVVKAELSLSQRNQLLSEMTNEIAQLVLADNYDQTRAITLATLNTHHDIELYRGYLNSLERDRQLDRSLEYLPDDRTLTERKILGKGLSMPEVAILLAYTKMQVKSQLLQLPDSDAPHFMQALASAFPQALRTRYAYHMQQHSLRREIIATKLSNRIVNEMGAVFFYRLKLETGADIDKILCAYLISRQVLNIDTLTQSLSAVADQLPMAIYAKVLQQINRLVRRTVRWFIQHYQEQLHHITELVQRFAQPVTQLQQILSNNPAHQDLAQEQQNKRLLAISSESAMLRITHIENEYALLDIAELSIRNAYTLEDAARAYLLVRAHFEFSWLRTQIRKQNSETHWDTLARAALLDDLDAQQYSLIQAFLGFVGLSGCTGALTTDHWKSWQSHHKDFSAHWQRLLMDLRSTTVELKLMMFSMAIRTLASLTRQLLI